MRMLLIGRLDNEAANKAILDGSMPKRIQELVERLNPEAAYFTTTGGQRTCYLVFDMQESSQMPPLGEPLFLAGGAVSFRPVMNLEDLQTGLAALGH
ncbi:hypothetical protein [Yinghuangia soli]|uniref:Uncharacterized protein n=1 Tax=Yinghuangia soli TaxID=2908204 RepID=A0AA41U050_9ACTN|nr:hypothetical protein [Yinghuangia soli]MCF2528211.1 hypothetical protein [Yinghuangia soli]